MSDALDRPHSRLSPSAATRWFACPGSVQLSAGAPKSTNPYAERGTAAHWLIEQCWGGDLPTVETHGGTIAPNDIVFDEDDIHAVRTHLQNRLLFELDAHYEEFVETQVSLPNIHPGLGGTVDFAVVDRAAKRLIVDDYKHGVGVHVPAKNNLQMMIYALGLIHVVLDGEIPETTELVIDQPRWRGGYKGPDTWVVTRKVFEEFIPRLREACRRTDDPNPILKTGPHCMWCPALAYHKGGVLYECPQFHKRRAQMGRLYETKDPTQLTDDERADAMQMAPLMEKWNAVNKSMAEEQIKARRPFPGYKLVRGPSTTVWADPTKALEWLIGLGLDATEVAKVKTPKQVRAAIAATHDSQEVNDCFDRLTTQRAPSLMLVPESDSRPAVQFSQPQDHFERIEP